MGIRIEWGNDEKTILLHIYEGNWTLEDYYRLIREHGELMNRVDHVVDVINDLRESGPIPGGMVSAIKYAARRVPPNEGMKLIVGANRFVTSLIDTINKTTPHGKTDVSYISTLEEAYAILAENRKKNGIQ